MKKKCVVAITIIIVSVGIAGKLWRDRVVVRQEKYRYKRAQHFYQQQDYKRSLTVVYAYKKILGKDKYYNSPWPHLEIKILHATRNIPRLVFLYEQNPELFTQYEEPSLLVARALLAAKLWRKYQQIVDSWHVAKKQHFQWFLLKVDAFIKKERTDEARKYLIESSVKFKNEAQLWVRLALLETQKNNFAKAWEYLEEGYSYDAQNSDLRLFRGQVLEKANKTKQARVEYVAAHLASPKNPIIADRLAEFYVRQSNYLAAMQIWQKNLDTAPAYILQKLAFYQKVAYNKNIVIDSDDAIVKAIVDLPKGVFWNAQCSKVDTGKNQYLFWLRMLHFIQNREHEQAYDLLEKSITRIAKPALRNNLHRVLFHRKYNGFTQGGTSFIRVKSSCCSLCTFLDDCARRERLQLAASDNQQMLQFATSPCVFAALFLCQNWLHAAVVLHETFSFDEIPEWYARRIMHAMSIVQNRSAAINFARKYPQMRSLQLLQAQFLIAENDLIAGCDLLRNLTKGEDSVAIRASWLLSRYYLERREYDLAKKVVDSKKSLRESTLGQETLARIFLLQNNKEQATKIYQKIAKESAEAKVFLAKEAFHNRNWQQAEKWTRMLQQEFPEQLKFSENMNKILEMKNKK